MMVKMKTLAGFISCVSEQFSMHSISERVIYSADIWNDLKPFLLGALDQNHFSQEEKVARSKIALEKDRIKDTYSLKTCLSYNIVQRENNIVNKIY